MDLLPDGRAQVQAAPGNGIEAAFGFLAREGQAPVSIEKMNEAIADGWAGLR